MTEQEYYEGGDFGGYQYTSLEEIVNNILANRDGDDYISTVPKYRVEYQAKRGLRELTFDVLGNIKAIELELSNTLSVIFPPDYVSYVRVSWVGDNGELRPMTIDRSRPIFVSYLQDHEYNLLFDDKGDVLRGSDESTIKNHSYNSDNKGCFTFRPNSDQSKVYSNGAFTIDNNEGIMQFSSDIEGRSIVLEYLSDGLAEDSGEIKVHKFAESAIYDYVYYELIKNRRNVPYNEKARARKEWFNSMRIAKRRLHKINKESLVQVNKGSTKWIK